MAQTFYPITPTEIVAPGAADWETMDASGSVPANATGVVLHVVNNQTTDAWDIGLRKPGSTDDRHPHIHDDMHFWAMIGVDANRYFEAYVGDTTDIDVYVVAYTMAGVTFKTNADDMSLGDIRDWTAIDCSTEAPSAIGLIWEVINDDSFDSFGLRKNGSSDDRHTDTREHRCFGAAIGCDASQICEGYIGATTVDFFLVGYITDGCTFNLNATDVSLGSSGSYIDLDALPATANMGFIELDVTPDTAYDFGLRKNGQSGGYYDIYRNAISHPWAFVECDASQIIEGKIEGTAIDFFVDGYSTAAAIFYQAVGGGAITPTGALGLKVSISMGAGSITPAGTLGRLIKIAMGSGAITPASTLGRKILLVVGAGAITAVGALNRKIKLTIGSGAITPVGVLGRLIKIAVGAGAIAPTGALSTIKKMLQSVGSGSITAIGTLGRKIKLAVGSGAITPASTLARKIMLAVGQGAITPTGALNWLYRCIVGSGAVSIAGALGRKISLVVGAGSVSIAGALNRLIKLTVGGGAVSIAGILGIKTQRIIQAFTNLRSIITATLRDITSFSNLRSIVSATKRTISSFSNLRRIK